MRAVVVTRDGLHPLIEAHDDHGKEEKHTVDDAVSTHGQVAAVLHHSTVDNQHDEARAGVHQEGREADAEDASHDGQLQEQRVLADKDHFRGARENPQLPAERHALRDDGGDGGTLDAHVEGIDEDGVEGGVEEHGEDGGGHRRAGMSGRAQDGIQAEVKMREDVAVEDPLHVFAGVGQCLVGGSEEAEDRVEKGEHGAHEQDAHEDVQRQTVAKVVLCLLAVLLAQAHTDHRGGADADHRAEGGAEVHQWEGDGEACNGHSPHALTDEHAIDHII